MVYVDAALNMQQNTCPFDVSGHPALTVPCAKVNGLPVGAMLVGRHFEETALLSGGAGAGAHGGLANPAEDVVRTDSTFCDLGHFAIAAAPVRFF